MCCRPIARDAARHRSEGKDNHASLAFYLQDGGRTRLDEVATSSGTLDPHPFESSQGIEQSHAFPIENMVVAEHATIDAGSEQALGVFGAHSVIDALGNVGVAARNAGFEVDNACIRMHPVQLVQSRAPDIGRRHMRRNPSIRLLGEPDIIAGRLHPILMEFGVTRMRQDLINAAARHDVTAEKNTDDLVRI